jgi:hypothetical protein
MTSAAEELLYTEFKNILISNAERVVENIDHSKWNFLWNYTEDANPCAFTAYAENERHLIKEKPLEEECGAVTCQWHESCETDVLDCVEIDPMFATTVQQLQETQNLFFCDEIGEECTES